MISRVAAGLPLPIYGDGQHRREWLHVEDQCEAILAVLDRGRPGQTYNVSSGVGVTNLELVARLCAVLDQRLPEGAPHRRLVQHVADRPGHDRRYALDISKISLETGWRARHSLDEGLAATVDWYLGHGDWVAAIRESPAWRAWMERNYRERS